MSSSHSLDLETLMRTGEVSQGQTDVQLLTGLHDRLTSTQGSLSWRASVARDEFNRPRVRMALEGTLGLQCQRCLGTLEHDVAHGWQVGVVADEAALPDLEDEGDDVDFIVAGQQVEVAQLIAEELLLSLPMMPRHDTEACHGPQQGQAAEDMQEVQETPVRASPFAALNKLRKP